MSRNLFTTQKFTSFSTSLPALSRTFSFEYSELPSNNNFNSDKYQVCNSWSEINKDVLSRHSQYIIQHISSNQQIIGIYVITQETVNIAFDSLKQYANILFKSFENDYINQSSKLILYYSSIKSKSNTVKEIVSEDNSTTNVNVKPLKVIPNLSKDMIITHHLSINCIFVNKQTKEERFNELMNIIKQYCLNINNNNTIIVNKESELLIHYPPFVPENENSKIIENGMLLNITGNIIIPLLISKMNNNNNDNNNIKQLLSEGIYRSLLGRFYCDNNKEFYDFLMNGGNYLIPLSYIYKSNDNSSFRCISYSSNDEQRIKDHNLMKFMYNEDIEEDTNNSLKEISKIEHTIINQQPKIEENVKKIEEPTIKVDEVKNKTEKEEIKQESIVMNSTCSGKSGSNTTMYIILAIITAIMSLFLFLFTNTHKSTN